MANETIAELIKKYGASSEERRNNKPEREEISHHQKQVEKENSGRTWSGANFGGGVWAGRGR